MKRTTKAEIEARNEQLRDENFALTLFIGECVKLPEPIDTFANDETTVQVFYVPRVMSGGYVILIETFAQHKPHVTGMSLYGDNGFKRFCDNRAAVGDYRWRDAEAKIESAHAALVRGEEARS